MILLLDLIIDINYLVLQNKGFLQLYRIMSLRPK